MQLNNAPGILLIGVQNTMPKSSGANDCHFSKQRHDLFVVFMKQGV
jgi:hypothetical protein